VVIPRGARRAAESAQNDYVVVVRRSSTHRRTEMEPIEVSPTVVAPERVTTILVKERLGF
jgi:hypothetical protein